MPLSPLPAASSQRWLERPGNRGEWEQLRKALDLAEGFQFFALQVGDLAAEAVLESLLQDEATRQGRTLVPIALSHSPAGTSSVGKLLEELSQAPRPCWFYLHGTSRLADCPAQLGELFLFLNQKRDVIAARAAAPLLLVLHRDEWGLFRRHAPDFWSIYQTVFRFEGVGEETRPSWTEDPESAREWARLRTRRLFFALGELVHAPHPLPTLAELGPPAVRFPGRSERKRLVAALSHPGAKVLVTGPPGSGKSALVREVAHQLAPSFPDGVFFLSPDPAEEDHPVFATQRRALETFWPKADLAYSNATLMRLFHAGTAGKRALIVLDEVEHPHLLRFLMPGEPLSLLVVSQLGNAPLEWKRLKLGSRLALGELGTSAAPVRYLSPGEGLHRPTNKANALIAFVESFTRNHDLSRQNARAQEMALQAAMTILMDRAEWAMTVDPALLAQRETVRLLPDCLAALGALKLGRNAEARDLFAKALEDSSQETPGHEVASFVARSFLAATEGLENYLSALEDAAEEARRRGDPGQLAWRVATLATLLLDRDLRRAEDLAEESRSLAREIFHLETEAEALDILAEVALLRGDGRRAESLERRALEIRQILHGDSHPAVALTWGRLAEALEVQGESTQALSLYRERQLPIYEGLRDNRGRAQAYGHMARIQGLLGRLEESIRLRRDEEIPFYELAGAQREATVARFHLAEALLERGREGDRVEALDLLRLASQTAEALNLPEAHAIREALTRLEDEPS